MTSYPQQFDMSNGYNAMNQQYVYPGQTFQPVVQAAAPAEQPGVSEIKKVLTRLCESYIHGTLAQPVPNPKKPGSFNKTDPKRSNIAKKIEQDAVKSVGQQQVSWYFKTYYFPTVNMAGSVSVISDFLSTRLSKSKQNYDVDCAQIALASLLEIMSKNPHTHLALENIGHSTTIHVLKYFSQYSSKDIRDRNAALPEDKRMSDEELEKYIEEHEKRVVQSFYDEFIVGVVDKAIEIVKNTCLGVVNQQGGIGVYSFDHNVRQTVRSYILSQMYNGITAEIENKISPFLGALLVEVDRKTYFDESLFEEKVKNTSNLITISELTVLMKQLGVVEKVSLGLPAWTRKELENGAVLYGSLELSEQRAHKLSYMFGMNWKGTSHTGEQSAPLGADGKRKAKVLNESQICTKITKTFSKHFDVPKTGKPRNAYALATHEKYIDISEAVISNGTGLQISASGENVVLPFIGILPNVNLNSVTSASHFENLSSEERLMMILSCIGYNESSAKMTSNRLQSIITDLHRVFGVTERVYHLNYAKKGGSRNGSIFVQPQTQQMHYYAPPAASSGSFTL